MTIRPLPMLLAAGLFAGCSSSSASTSPSPSPTTTSTTTPPGPDAGTAADAGSGTTLAPPAAGKGVQFSMQTTIAAGTEDERCKFVQATEDLWVDQEEVESTPRAATTSSSGTRRTRPSPRTTTASRPSTPRASSTAWAGPPRRGTPPSSSAARSPRTRRTSWARFPADTALHIPAGSVLVMDLHVLNASSAPLAPDRAINLDTIPQSQVKQEAGIYFFYNPFIASRPASMAHARMSCPVTSDVTLTTAQTHMHKWGLGGTANLEDSTGTVIQRSTPAPCGPIPPSPSGPPRHGPAGRPADRLRVQLPPTTAPPRSSRASRP